MSEHDYALANADGATFRTDLNNALLAVVSNNSKATAPSTTFAYMWWADTGNDLLKQRNAADSAWISILTLSTGVPSTLTPLAANLVGADFTLSRVNLLDIGVITNAIGSTGGGTQSINLTLGNSVSATVDTSANTFTFDNPTASDEGCGFRLVLTNGGSQTVNWPASVDWQGGTAPTLTTAGVDILDFFTLDGGTTWHGIASSLDSK
jgi:hypothetical protein